MNEDFYERLRGKGWSNADITKAMSIIEKANEKKTDKIRVLDLLIYWFVLIVAIIGNLVISLALVPFLLEFRNFFLYVIIAILALVFGFLFDLLIRDIESLEQKHVIIAGIFIPALAVINIFYITNFSNYVSAALNLNNTHSPFFVSAVYVAAFSAPYLFYRVINKKPLF